MTTNTILFDGAVTRIKQCRHGLMMYFKNDQYVGRSLDEYGEFSEAEVSFFKQAATPGDVVVEVGANIGAHTVMLAKAVGGQGKVIAFEPQRRVSQVLNANIALNELSNVSCHYLGLGDRNGHTQMLDLDLNQVNNIGGLSMGTREGMTKYSSVEVRTLDSFNFQEVKLLKIDVEGMEKMVLDGAKETITRCKPIMYIENDRPEKSQELIKTIFELGYQAWWHLPLFFNPDNFAGRSDDVFTPLLRSVNLMCLPKEMNAQIIGMPPVESETDTWEDKGAMGCY